MGEEDSDDLLDEGAFRQIEVDVSIDNLTSGTGVAGAVRKFGEFTVSQGPNPMAIRLMEILPTGVALDVPPKTGAAGHTVRVSFDVQGAKVPFTFSAKGTVASVTSLEGGRDKFEVNLTEYEPEYLDALRSMFDRRQAEIDEFLEAVRG